MPEPGASPPDILHVIHGLWVGGAEVDLIGKLRFLHREHGYPITVCCLMRRGDLAGALEADGAKVIGPLMTHRRDPQSVVTLRRLISRRKWDFVHSHMYEASLITGLALATLHSRPRWVVSEHAMADYWSPVPLRVLRLLARRSAAFIVPTRSAAESYAGRGFVSDRLRVIPNGIDPTTTGRSVSRERMRESLGVGPEEILLGTVCRLHAVKALPILFEAVSTLPVRLVVAGDGPAREELETLVAARGWKDRVHLLGTRADVPDLLAAFDVFVLSSRSESMSIAVAEALLAGVPVVATRTGGVPEITGDGTFARLVTPGDVGALREGILATLADLVAARLAAQAGGAWVREHLDVATTGRRLHEFYREASTER